MCAKARYAILECSKISDNTPPDTGMKGIKFPYHKTWKEYYLIIEMIKMIQLKYLSQVIQTIQIDPIRIIPKNYLK